METVYDGHDAGADADRTRPADAHERRMRAMKGSRIFSHLDLAALAGLPALSGLSALARGGGGGPKVVVELFTSQGCNSCPPADAFLHELADRADVHAISYNVDYWNHLGWRDTLSKPDFTRRQRMYARARGDMEIYTPQIVVNGHHHAVGTDRRRVLRLIEQEKRKGGCSLVPLRARKDGDVLVVDAGAAAGKLKGRKATLWAVPVRREVKVKILRGENAGRKISYHHVARGIIPAAMWQGEEGRLKLPLREIMKSKADMCYLLLQLRGHGRIIGAARI